MVSQRASPFRSQDPPSDPDVWCVQVRFADARPHALTACLSDGKSAVEALNEALDNIEQMAQTVLDKYEASLKEGDFELVEDEKHDFESVNQRLWAQKEAEGRGTYEDFLAEKKRKEDVEAKQKKGGKAVKGGR